MVGDTEDTSGSWGSSEITAGDSYTIDDSASAADLESDETVRVTWKSQESGKSSTLASSTIP